MVQLSGDRSVAVRLFSLLEAFSPQRPELSLSELSRRTGLPLATTHRLVGELTGLGALERSAEGRYRVGLRLWEIASLAPRSVELREAALPYLEDLYEATHENVQLAVLDGLDVVYVERISGRHAIGVLSRVGARWPLHATGVGLVLLAHADHELRERVLSSPLRTFTELTIGDAHTLRGVLAEARQTGIVISDRQITMDAVSVAAPVRGPGQAVVAALSVVVPSEGFPVRPLIPAVRAAARGISHALGHRAPAQGAGAGRGSPGSRPFP